MTSKTSKFLVATLATLLIAGCGKNVMAPVGGERGATGLNLAEVAANLAKAPADSATFIQYLLFTEEQRTELRSELHRYLSEDRMATRKDLVAIVGPAPSDSVTIDAAYQRDRTTARQPSPNAITEYIPVGGIPQFSQRDSRWSGKGLGYGTSGTTIGGYGCYVTDIAMLTAFWGYSVNPATMNDWAVGSRPHYAFQSNSDLIRTTEALQYPGSICRSWSYLSASDFEGVRRQLRAGHPVIVKVSWGGTHFMVVYCWDGSQFWVLDPWQTGGSICRALNSTYGSILEFRLLGYNPV